MNKMSDYKAITTPVALTKLRHTISDARLVQPVSFSYKRFLFVCVHSLLIKSHCC